MLASMQNRMRRESRYVELLKKISLSARPEEQMAPALLVSRGAQVSRTDSQELACSTVPITIRKHSSQSSSH